MWFLRHRRHPAGRGRLATACAKPAAVLRWAVLHSACRHRRRRRAMHDRVALRGVHQGGGHRRPPTQARTLRVGRLRRPRRWEQWHGRGVVEVVAEAATQAVPVTAIAPDRWTARRRHLAGQRCGRDGVVAGSVRHQTSLHRPRPVVAGARLTLRPSASRRKTSILTAAPRTLVLSARSTRSNPAGVATKSLAPAAPDDRRQSTLHLTRRRRHLRLPSRQHRRMSGDRAAAVPARSSSWRGRQDRTSHRHRHPRMVEGLACLRQTPAGLRGGGTCPAACSSRRHLPHRQVTRVGRQCVPPTVASASASTSPDRRFHRLHRRRLTAASLRRVDVAVRSAAGRAVAVGAALPRLETLRPLVSRR